MGSVKPLKTLEGHESFYKWFLEIEEKVFEGLPQDQEEDIGRKRRMERVKKLMSHFLNSEVCLELSEDERSNSNFVLKHCPLEVVAIVGGLAFFQAYVNKDVSNEHLQRVTRLVQAYLKTESSSIPVLEAMKYVLTSLTSYCSNIETEACRNFHEDSVLGDSANLCIKLAFLMGFPRHVDLGSTMDLFIQKISSGEGCGYLDIQIYKWTRFRRMSKELNKKFGYEDLKQEKLLVESVCKTLPHNPVAKLALCEFLGDFLSCAGPENLTINNNNFQSHSEVVKFIRETAETITNEHPSFLRANFAFADMFAHTLPITKQDREYAKALLAKALDSNLQCSKINHKMGLFLVKSREFSESKSYLKKAIALDPSSSFAYYSLAKLLLRDAENNKIDLDEFFNIEFDDVDERLGPETELSFWKGCYLFMIGETDVAISVWIETILEFYMTKPELNLETVLPFKKLPETARYYHWVQNRLTLGAVAESVEAAAKMDKTPYRVVYHRLKDLVKEAMSH